MKELLNIVSEDDEIIGAETREKIHQEGLLHRETHVYFVTPKREIIFQHRAKDKDTYPDLLDATVGGHVEIGDSYEETALKESLEETGIKIDPCDLLLIKKIRKNAEDKVTGKINNVFTSRYLYIYRGDVADLKVEKGKAIGFEVWSMERLTNLSDKERARFIQAILDFAPTLFGFIKGLKL
ncbi:MAG: NUDIX domain-containing protein [Candidatus Falkowbacteria bacterium]|nr:NUDIX domain-containing protein [Candidatus Falkowbacteria bacterium]